MEGLICCCGARSWTKAITWLQIILCPLGLFFVGGGLITVLMAGQDAVDRVTDEHPENHPQLEEASRVDFDWSLIFLSDYFKLVVFLAVCVMLLILGIILAAFLIKGVNESKSGYLKCWVLHAVVCLAWLILSEGLSADGLQSFVLRISVSCSVYGFCIWVVVSLIREIDQEQRLRKAGHPVHKHTPSLPVKV